MLHINRAHKKKTILLFLSFNRRLFTSKIFREVYHTFEHFQRLWPFIVILNAIITTYSTAVGRNRIQRNYLINIMVKPRDFFSKRLLVLFFCGRVKRISLPSGCSAICVVARVRDVRELASYYFMERDPW